MPSELTFLRAEDMNELRPAADSQPRRSLIDRDPCEPGGECGLAAKLVKMGERLQVGLLDHVLGLVTVEHDAAGDAIEAAVVLRHDEAQRLLFARQGARREQAFVAPLDLRRYLRRVRAFHPIGPFDALKDKAYRRDHRSSGGAFMLASADRRTLRLRLGGELQPLFLSGGERLRQFLTLRREARRFLRIARESVGRGERLVDAGDQLREFLDARLGGGELAPRLPGVAALRRLLL